MDGDQIDPLKLLKDDLHDDDYEQSITAVKRLDTIAYALGPARTRNELIPFLLVYADQDNDEGFTIIAKQLGDFHELIGGSTHVPVLLPLLEKFTGVEEFIVRDTAVTSLCKLALHLSPQDIDKKFVPLIRRLANGDWFTTRVSAASLFTPAYPHVSEQLKEELRNLFSNLCGDDTPMVRKAAYKNLGMFGAEVSAAHFQTDIVPLIKTVSQDDVDIMRLETINCCVAIGSRCEPGEFGATILPILEALCEDPSWRVRKLMAEQSAVLCRTIEQSLRGSKMLPIFAKLVTDKEAEVRTAAASVIGAVSVECKDGVQERLVPVLEGLATDSVQAVRVQLSKTIVSVAEAMSKEQATKVLLPIIVTLSKDEHPEVRNGIVETLEPLLETGMSSLLPVVATLAKDPKWRVRAAVVNQCSVLANKLKLQGFDESKLQDIIISGLSDHVYKIRENCGQQIGQLVDLFGGRWAAEKLLPHAFEIYKQDKNYIHRMTCLLVCQNCVAVAGTETVEGSLLPLVEQAVTDDVPNVRIAAAQVLKAMCAAVGKDTVQGKLQPLLKKLTEDTDKDVSYFARQGLKAC